MADSKILGWAKNRNGKSHPIHEPKGSGRSKVVAGALLGGFVLYAGGAGGLGSSVGGTVGSSALSQAESQIVQQARTNLRSAKKTARRGKSQKAWQRLGLRRGQKTRRTAQEPAECVTFTYGQVQEFLIENPCRGVHRGSSGCPTTAARCRC
ncbi:hypothetical protein [Salinifilum ghardaiensis]